MLKTKNYDFIFLPHYLLDKLSTSLDLTINTVSFQEMTKNQVDHYCSKINSLKCPKLYSYNRHQNLNNPDLGNLTSIIEKYYKTSFFNFPTQGPSIKRISDYPDIIKSYIKKVKVLHKLYRLAKTGDASLNDYSYYHGLGNIIE